MSQDSPQAHTLDTIFRHEKSRIVASLVRLVGGLEEAEDCFSEAVEAALKTWPLRGQPDNPAAWLTTVARNKAIDLVRSQQRSQSREARALLLDQDPAGCDEDRLSLIFTCCHPALPLEGRVALTLRTLGGLSTSQIAAAFLVPEATMAQRLVRAQKKIRQAGIPFRIPPPDLLQARLDGVLSTLYLVFNESYWPTHRDTGSLDTGQEAIALAEMLANLMPREAEPLGLVALMCLQHSRAPARLGPQGEAVILEEQDRALWNKQLMASGYSHLDKAMRLGQRGPYQIQAAIAAMHCLAADGASTDWPKIVALYDALLMLTPNPVIELNRAMAVGMAFSPQEGLRALAGLATPLSSYPPFHATEADLLRRAGQPCREAYERALSMEQNVAARRFLVRRIRELES